MILDLDGTLVDTVPDLTAALNRIAAPRGMAPFDEREVVPMVGDGLHVLAERAFAARARAAGPADIADLSADYGAHAAERSLPYPGVVAGLRELSHDGWRLAVCTNKPEAAARTLLAALGLEPFFAAVCGGDSVAARKPDPAHLLAAIRAAGGDAGHSLMVGDHRNDVAAANGAGVPCIFAAWGYGPAEMGAPAAATAGSFAAVPAIAARLVPAQGP